MKYCNLSDAQKKDIILSEYVNKKYSFNMIAKKYDTYSNQLRRDAIKFNIPIRNKSEAQKNALKTGRHKHPTKGQSRPEEVKNKIGMSVLQSWENLSDTELEQRRGKARDNWNKLTQEEKSNILSSANIAVRNSSKVGSKLEHFLLNSLLADGYKVDFHKEQTLSNTKLQIDLFLATINTAIEVDGPSHFNPVWGEDTLKKNITYDTKKNGLILGKGWVLIRIKQTKDFSKSRAQKIYEQLKEILSEISKQLPPKADRYIQIGDKDG